ncbi:MAG: hypothetical protein ACR2J6_02135 [Thermoleophilaceae bacterium]
MTRALAAAVAAIALFVAVAPASANPIDDYRRNGTIDPCKYSDGQLKKGRDNLPPDVEQYAPGLADQLSAGREGCGGSSPGGTNPRQTQAVPAPGAPTNGDGPGGSGGSGGATAAGGAAAVGGVNVPAPPAPTAAARRRLGDISTPPVSARVNDGTPAWVGWLLLVLLALAALWAALRRTGLDAERFTRPLRVSFGDAGGRTADAAAELWDRVRLGR